MKKWMYVLLAGLLCFKLLLTACGRSGNEDEDYYAIVDDAITEAVNTDTNDDETIDTHIEDEVPAKIDNEAPAPAYISHSDFTTVHFIEDLDYMLYAMQNNFALFDVAYWARGVDIYAIFDAVRESVFSNPEMTVDEFFDVIYYQFDALVPIGHFRIINPAFHNDMLNESGGEMWRHFFPVMQMLGYVSLM